MTLVCLNAVGPPIHHYNQQPTSNGHKIIQKMPYNVYDNDINILYILSFLVTGSQVIASTYTTKVTDNWTHAQKL